MELFFFSLKINRWILHLLLSTLVTFFAFQSSVADISCSVLLGDESQSETLHWTDQDVIDLLTHLSSLKDPKNSKSAEDFFQNFERYRDYLQKNGKYHSTTEAMKFLKSELEAMARNFNLEKEQETSLEQQLQNFGAREGSIRGRKKLAHLSAKNTHRILRDFQLTPKENLPLEIQALVNQLQLQFYHNADSTQFTGPIMLSSQRWAGLGLGKTLQHGSEFNRDFLKTADQLYFYVEPFIQSLASDRSENSKSLSNQYGKNRFYLSPSEAKKTGWISPYIMHETDLIDYYNHLQNKPMGPNPNLAQIKDLLYLNVFTTNDFLYLYQTIIGNALMAQLRVDVPHVSFEKIRDALSGQRPYPRSQALSDLRDIMSAFGISGGIMELKVPVGFKTDQLNRPN